MIKIYNFELKNGLKVYYLFNPLSLISFVQLWYHIGSAQEKKEKNGITHLIEHLFFKGTKEIKAEEYSRIIQKEGGICNAFTSEEKVCFYETIPTNKLELVLKMESDRMENLDITEDVFLNEKKVVLEEYKERIQNQPIIKPLIKIRNEIFGEHPFSMDPAGNEETISNIRYADIIEFYNDYFHPKNASLILTSSHKIDELKEIVEKYFGKILKIGKIPSPIPKIEKPEKEYAEAKIPLKANMFSKTFFMEKRNEYYFPLHILHNLLGAQEDSLLKKEIQEKKFYVLQAGTFPFFSNSGILFLFFSLHLPIFKKYNFIKLIDKILKEKVKEVLNKEKFEELKGRLIIQMISSLHGTEKIGSYFAECIISRGNPENFFSDYEAIKKLKIEDIFYTLEKLKNSPSCTVLLKGSICQKG